MEATLSAENRRLYGDVTASDHTSVIVGDCNVRIERPIVNLSYHFMHDNLSSVDHLEKRLERARLATALHPSPAPGLYSDMKYNPGMHIDVRGSCDVELKRSKTAGQVSKNVEYHEDVHRIGRSTALANAISTSTIKEMSKQINRAFTSESTHAHSLVIDSGRPFSTSSTAESRIESRKLETTATSPHGPKLPNHDYPRGSSAASSQTPSGAQVSVIFLDDLSKPYAFAAHNRQHRIFFLRTKEPGWANSTCMESFMPICQIHDRIHHGPTKLRQKKQNITRILQRLEPRRRSVADLLLREINGQDPCSQKWEIVAIDNEYPKSTRLPREVAVFTVIVAKVPDDLSSR